VVLGVLGGLAVAPAVGGSAKLGLVVAGLGFGLLGLVDDVHPIAARSRLALQGMAAALALPWVLDGLSGSPAWRALFTVTVLVWLVAFVNAFNFMDGINGMAVAQVMVAGAAWYAIGHGQHVASLATFGPILAAAAVGFAPYNFPVARVFLGDVGSYFLGATLAVLAVEGLRAGLAPEAVLAPLSVYLVDTASTLVRRVRRGERWYEAHRDHAYQRLVREGLSHTVVTSLATAAMVFTSLLGMATLTATVVERVLADVGIGLVLVAYLALPRLLARSSSNPAAA